MQKFIFPKMMAIKTAQAVDCSEVMTPDAAPPKPTSRATARRMENLEIMLLSGMDAAVSCDSLMTNYSQKSFAAKFFNEMRPAGFPS